MVIKARRTPPQSSTIVETEPGAQDLISILIWSPTGVSRSCGRSYNLKSKDKHTPELLMSLYLWHSCSSKHFLWKRRPYFVRQNLDDCIRFKALVTLSLATPSLFFNWKYQIQGTGDFDYGHTLDADTIRISSIIQAGNDIDENGVRIPI